MYVDLKFQDNTAVLTLGRTRTNSLDREFLKEIYEAICRLDSMEEVNAVVITSLLPFGFSSGLDLGSLFEEGSPEKTGKNICDAVKQVYDINMKIMSSRKMFVAALSGPVIGSGASMALCCDLRVATERTWFWIPEPQYGGLSADGSIEVLCAKVGASRAAMLLLTNDRINACTANEWGLIYRLAPPESLQKTAMELAGRLAGYSPGSMGLTKKIINGCVNPRFHGSMLDGLTGSAESYNRLAPFMNGRRQ